MRLVEPDNGDFAVTIVRLLLFSTWRLALLQRLVASRDQVLSAIAAKGVKEVTYHRDYAGRWFLTLAQGTEESRRRLVAALTVVWPMHDELFRSHAVEQAGRRAAASGSTRRRSADEVDVLLEQVFSVSGVERPRRAAGRPGQPAAPAATAGTPRRSASCSPRCRSVARAHPRGRW